MLNYVQNEFIKDFDLSKIQKTDLVSFNKEKLDWFNNQYLWKITNEEFLERLKYWSQRFNMPCMLNDLSEIYSHRQLIKIISLNTLIFFSIISLGIFVRDKY
jgi:glutamyl/glutaminyl-tRNA synthetase